MAAKLPSFAMTGAATGLSPARFDGNVVAGAKPGPFPGFVEPSHPTRDEAPSGGRWIHQIKFEVTGHKRTCETASLPSTPAQARLDAALQPIADALATLPATDLILDGEAVVAESRGVPDFGLLHADLAAGRKDPLLYYRQPGHPSTASTRSLGKPRGFDVLAPSRPGTFCKPPTRLQRL
jgi:hypothetical protein